MRNNERPVEEERPPSMAAGELLQLRQRHTVSGLRYAHVLLASLKNVLNFSFHDVFFSPFHRNNILYGAFQPR